MHAAQGRETAGEVEAGAWRRRAGSWRQAAACHAEVVHGQIRRGLRRMRGGVGGCEQADRMGIAVGRMGGGVLLDELHTKEWIPPPLAACGLCPASFAG